MNYAALKAEVVARGFDYLTTARQGQFVNDAMHELDELYQWPYREASVTGTAPMTIANLGTIEQVTDETLNVPLQPRTFQNLTLTYGDVSQSGNPAFFYVAWPSGAPVVATFPTNSNTIGVQYWKIADDLASDSDTPLSPSRFHNIIVDIACRMAYRDNDEASAADALQGEIDRKIARMVNALLGGQQLQGAQDFTRVFYNSEDW